MSKYINEEKIRRMYRLSWSSGEHYNLFCSQCVDKALREDYIEDSREVSTGTCYLCDYERDEEVISLEKALFIENQIEEMKRLIQKVSSLEREVRIDQLVFHRTERYDNPVRGFTDPVDIRQSLQFPITLKKELVINLIEKHIETLKLKKEVILSN